MAPSLCPHPGSIASVGPLASLPSWAGPGTSDVWVPSAWGHASRVWGGKHGYREQGIRLGGRCWVGWSRTPGGTWGGPLGRAAGLGCCDCRGGRDRVSAQGWLTWSRGTFCPAGAQELEAHLSHPLLCGLRCVSDPRARHRPPVCYPQGAGVADTRALRAVPPRPARSPSPCAGSLSRTFSVVRVGPGLPPKPD